MSEFIDNLIKKGDYPNVLFIFGEEEFLIDEATHKLINSLCPDEMSRYDLDVISGDETTQNEISIKAGAFPMSSDRRVVVVKNIAPLFSSRVKKAPKGSPLASYLASPSPNTILIITAEIDTFSGISSQLKGKNSAAAQKQIDNAKFPYNILLSKYPWVEFPNFTNRLIQVGSLNESKHKANQ